LKERTKIALIQNTFVGVPVIIAISIFNAIFATSSPLFHGLGSAIVGYLVSLIFVYLSLKLLRLERRRTAATATTTTIKSSKADSRINEPEMLGTSLADSRE
jgi:hypothetical protein